MNPTRVVVMPFKERKRLCFNFGVRKCFRIHNIFHISVGRTYTENQKVFQRVSKPHKAVCLCEKRGLSMNIVIIIGIVMERTKIKIGVQGSFELSSVYLNGFQSCSLSFVCYWSSWRHFLSYLRCSSTNSFSFGWHNWFDNEMNALWRNWQFNGMNGIVALLNDIIFPKKLASYKNINWKKK